MKTNGGKKALGFNERNYRDYSVSINLISVGFISTSVQILLFREILNISGGYELISGIFFGCWLIASSAGALAAGKSETENLRVINLLFSAGPLVTLVLMLILARMLLNPGETPSFLLSLVYLFLILMPFCFISGFSFIRILSVAVKTEGFIPGRSFALETTGSIAAGVFVTIVTAGLMNTYKFLLMIVLTSLTYTLLTFYTSTKYGRDIKKIIIAGLFSLLILTEPDLIFRQVLLPGINVSETIDTPYGNITTGEYTGEQSVYYNQRLIKYKDDVAEREEDIHYALLQRPDPQKVLIISGNPGSYINELKKYSLDKITWVERDPYLVGKLIAQNDSNAPDLDIENEDAFRYIKKQKEQYDAIILMLPPPSTLSINRFYTTEFFSDVQKNLLTGGVFMCAPGSMDNYLNQQGINLYSSVFNSLQNVFRYVKPVAGNKFYFIASDDSVSVSFCRLSEERGIKNVYVSDDFLSDDLITRKTDEIFSLIDFNIRQNKAIFPIACFYYQSYHLSRSPHEKIPALIIMIIIFAIPLIFVRSNNMLMYLSASALAGYEIIILLILQLTIGNIYQFSGMILAVLMAGMAVGAGTSSLLINRLSLRTKALILLFYYLATGLSGNLLLSIANSTITTLIILISLILPSVITGNIFRELTMDKQGYLSTASTYSADLGGSASGFILSSGFLIPFFGIKTSLILLAFLILTGILFGTKHNK